MPNFVNLYFAICLIAWVVSMVLVGIVLVVKPLRMWCWRKYKQLACIFYKLAFELAEDMESSDE